MFVLRKAISGGLKTLQSRIINVNPTLEKVGGHGIQSTSIVVKRKSSLLRWRKNTEIHNKEDINIKLHKKFLIHFFHIVERWPGEKMLAYYNLMIFFLETFRIHGNINSSAPPTTTTLCIVAITLHLNN